MIIEHRTRDKHQNADSLSRKTEFYERQEQMEADRPEIKDGFSFMDQETYDSLLLTRWLDKSGKPTEDHPELPTEHQEKAILKRTPGMPIEMLLKSKIVREPLKAKGYDLNEVDLDETGKATVGQDLMRLLKKLADDKPVVSNRGNDEPEVTIMKRGEVTHDGGSKKAGEPENKEVVRTLVEKTPKDILRRTTLRRKKVSFKKEVKDLRLDQESGEWQTSERYCEEKKLCRESEEWDKGSEECDDFQDSLCKILAEEEKSSYHDRKLQTDDSSSGTYNLEHPDVNGGEELEMIAVSRKPFRELSCNSNIRTNLG